MASSLSSSSAASSGGGGGGGACGSEVAGGVCSTRIYPKEVIKSVRQEMKSLTLDPKSTVEVPERMELDGGLKATDWKDAAVCTIKMKKQETWYVWQVYGISNVVYFLCVWR